MIGAALASVAVGVAIGLGYAWLGSSVQFSNAHPADLQPSIKEDYVQLISASYELNGNLVVAKRRINALALSDPARTFNDLITQEKQALGNSVNQDSLIHLGQALGYKIAFVAQRPAPGTRSPFDSSTLAQPTTSIPSFALKERTRLSCNEESEAAMLRLYVRDVAGRDLPNIAISVRWENGEDIVYTGLKPERGNGYADVQVEPGTFAITVLNARSDTVSGLLIGPAPVNCRNDRGATPRGWKIVFQQK